MSLRTRLRVAIVASIGTVIIVLSLVYLINFMELAFTSTFDRARLVANQVKGAVSLDIEQRASQRNPAPTTLDESREVWTQIVRTDPDIRQLLNETLANSNALEVFIAGADGEVLVSTVPSRIGAKGWNEPEYQRWNEQGRAAKLFSVMTKRESYAVTVPIGVKQKKIFSIVVLISSVFVRDTINGPLGDLLVLFVTFLLFSVGMAFLLPDVILRPLERLSKKIDLISTGAFPVMKSETLGESKEFADVQSKLNALGQQYLGAKEDANELRSNVEHLLQRLEEAVLLFDPKGRLMMAGRPVERLLGWDPEAAIGRSLEDVFPASTALGSAIQSAVARRQPLQDVVVPVEKDGVPIARLLLNVELLAGNSGSHQIGTLITLRDAETRRQIEWQLDVSNRLAAISRLTGGVAHEIKNPLNAIALHVEVLKTKLENETPEIQVIATEISRLDRVVRTFLDFTRPLTLQFVDIDLTNLAKELADLVRPDAASKGIKVEFEANGRSVHLRGDVDLLKQAILNVAINAIEAMPMGGLLRICVERHGDECVATITDTGPGIPLAVQDKVFNLYFTTKSRGSGIGLAMTFRVVQLHNGTLDFESTPGTGTSFRFRFPEALSASLPQLQKTPSAAVPR